MNWRSLLLIMVCVSSGLIQRPIQAYPIANSAAVVSRSSQLSTAQLKQLAQSITVKVLSGETWGSGILLHQQGQVYTVLTNEHVLTPGYGKPYRIQTPDGQIYPAVVLRTPKLEGNDLGVLQFRSNTLTYTVASLGDSVTLTPGESVFAAGFPFGVTGFILTTGKVSLMLSKALEGGYQIGYTNNIQKGMSGGPLLNQQGKLVGINGRHAYPLWGNGYRFQDGSLPQESLQEQLIQLSWAVPVEVFEQQAGQFASSVPLPSFPASQPIRIEPTSPTILPFNDWLW